ncbi:3858_t:CDS:2, partial [Dentiscutata heterogama]
MKNNNYAKAKSYLEVLSRWHEWWALAYLKDCFFINMLSTQREESINSLLKDFVNCKTRLIEFLEAFEYALDLCKEAEHIFAYKKLVYPILLTFPNLIKNQAASCLTCCYNLEFARIVCHHSLVAAVYLSFAYLDLVHFSKHWQKDQLKLELVKDYVNFYSQSQSQTPGILISHKLFGK